MDFSHKKLLVSLKYALSPSCIQLGAFLEAINRSQSTSDLYAKNSAAGPLYIPVLVLGVKDLHIFFLALTSNYLISSTHNTNILFALILLPILFATAFVFTLLLPKQIVRQKDL